MTILRNARAMVLVYALLLVANMMSRALSLDWLNYVTKPLLMPLLALLLWQKSAAGWKQNKLILFALATAWLGDVLLMLPMGGSATFIAGLLSFLTTHVLYSRYFYAQVRRKAVGSPQWINLVTVLSVVYAIGYFAVLYPHLKQMMAPVALYTGAITLMLILSNLFRLHVHHETGQKFLAGSVLFVLSDSLLAYSLFVRHFSLDGVWIMLTYGIAQAFITAAVLDYHQVEPKELPQ